MLLFLQMCFLYTFTKYIIAIAFLHSHVAKYQVLLPVLCNSHLHAEGCQGAQISSPHRRRQPVRGARVDASTGDWIPSRVQWAPGATRNKQ